MWRVAGFSRPYKSSQADRVSGIDILRRYRGNISLSVEAKSVGRRARMAQTSHQYGLVYGVHPVVLLYIISPVSPYPPSVV